MQTETVKLTGAIAIAGQIVRAGNLVEVTPREARDLIRRGKAVPHRGEVPADAVVVASGTTDPEPHPVIAQHQQDQAERDAEVQADAAAAVPPVDAVTAAEPVAAVAPVEAPAAEPRRRGRPPKAKE